VQETARFSAPRLLLLTALHATRWSFEVNRGEEATCRLSALPTRHVLGLQTGSHLSTSNDAFFLLILQ